MNLMRVKIIFTFLAASVMLPGCTSKDERGLAAATQAESDFQQGLYDSALTNIRMAISFRDDVSDYWLLLARINIATQDFPGAFDAYQNVYQLDRGNLEALRQLCQLGLTVRQPEKVDQYADQLLLLNPGDPVPLIMKGSAALQRSDSATALSYADKVLATNPGDINALILKGHVLAYKGDNHGAAKLIESTLTMAGDPIARLTFLKEIYGNIGDKAGYTRILTKLSELRISDPQIQIEYADWLYQNNRPDQAFLIIGRIMKRRPHDLGLASLVLETWIDAGKIALSREQILSGKSSSLEMKAAFAQYANEMGQPDLAIAVLGGLLPSGLPNASNSDTKAAFAFALGLKGRGGDALDQLQEILDVDPAQPRALLSRARLRAANGDLSGALADARKVVADDPANATARLALYNILATKNEPILAESSLREGLQAKPNSVRITEGLASILLKSGRKDEAISVLQMLTRAAPVSIRAQRLITHFNVIPNAELNMPTMG